MDKEPSPRSTAHALECLAFLLLRECGNEFSGPLGNHQLEPTPTNSRVPIPILRHGFAKAHPSGEEGTGHGPCSQRGGPDCINVGLECFPRSPRDRCPFTVTFFGWEGSPTKIDYRKKSWYPYSNLSTGGPRLDVS